MSQQQHNQQQRSAQQQKPQFQFVKFDEKYIPQCMQLILDNFHTHHPLYTHLDASDELLTKHCMPIFLNKDHWKYSVICVNQTTGKVVGYAIQKDLAIEIRRDERKLSDDPSISFTQKIYWTLKDQMLEDYKEKIVDFKIDQNNEEILGNIGENAIMYMEMTMVDGAHRKYQLGSMLQLFCEQIAIQNGYVYGFAECINDRQLAIAEKSFNVVHNFRIDLKEREYKGTYPFVNAKQQYVYIVSGCYKNVHKRNMVMNFGKQYKAKL